MWPGLRMLDFSNVSPAARFLSPALLGSWIMSCSTPERDDFISAIQTFTSAISLQRRWCRIWSWLCLLTSVSMFILITLIKNFKKIRSSALHRNTVGIQYQPSYSLHWPPTTTNLSLSKDPTVLWFSAVKHPSYWDSFKLNWPCNVCDFNKHSEDLLISLNSDYAEKNFSQVVNSIKSSFP